MPELQMQKNGHSIVTTTSNGIQVYKCDDCNELFLSLDAVEERYSCPE